MNRREFLRASTALVAAPAVQPLVALIPAATPALSIAEMLARSMMESKAAACATVLNRTFSGAAFAEILRPGLEDVFRDAYDSLPA